MNYLLQASMRQSRKTNRNRTIQGKGPSPTQEPCLAHKRYSAFYVLPRLNLFAIVCKLLQHL
jgi:hypothetical protein